MKVRVSIYDTRTQITYLSGAEEMDQAQMEAKIGEIGMYPNSPNSTTTLRVEYLEKAGRDRILKLDPLETMVFPSGKIGRDCVLSLMIEEDGCNMVLPSGAEIPPAVGVPFQGKIVDLAKNQVICPRCKGIGFDSPIGSKCRECQGIGSIMMK